MYKKKSIYINKINIFYINQTKIQLIRPLLHLKRTEIKQLCLFWALPISIDKTNWLIKLRRNRLRHQVLPLLRVFLNPKIDYALARFSEYIYKDVCVLNQQIYEIKNFYYFNILFLESFNKFKNYKWVNYLPLNLQQNFFYHLLSLYFKNLTFFKIKKLLNK